MDGGASAYTARYAELISRADDLVLTHVPTRGVEKLHRVPIAGYNVYGVRLAFRIRM
jgi:hypothetical protein